MSSAASSIKRVDILACSAQETTTAESEATGGAGVDVHENCSERSRPPGTVMERRLAEASEVTSVADSRTLGGFDVQSSRPDGGVDNLGLPPGERPDLEDVAPENPFAALMDEMYEASQTPSLPETERQEVLAAARYLLQGLATPPLHADASTVVSLNSCLALLLRRDEPEGDERIAAAESLWAQAQDVDAPASMASALLKLAEAHARRDAWAQARARAAEAVEIRRQKLDFWRPELAEALYAQARYEERLGNVDDAKRLRDAGLRISSLAQVKAPQWSAEMMQTAAKADADTLSHGTAVQLGEAALRALRADLGDGHPDVGRACHHLAARCEGLGEWARAIELGEEAVATLGEALGNDHSDTLSATSNLAEYYGARRAEGDLEKALGLGERALEAMRRTLGESDPHTAGSMSNLSNWYAERHAEGDLEKALELGERALEAKRRTLGESHPDTAISMANLSNRYAERGAEGDLEKARRLSERALAVFRNTLGELHPHTATARSIVAEMQDTRRPPSRSTGANSSS